MENVYIVIFLQLAFNIYKVGFNFKTQTKPNSGVNNFKKIIIVDWCYTCSWYNTLPYGITEDQ
jgi:hypothetical protein